MTRPSATVSVNRTDNGTGVMHNGRVGSPPETQPFSASTEGYGLGCNRDNHWTQGPEAGLSRLALRNPLLNLFLLG